MSEMEQRLPHKKQCLLHSRHYGVIQDADRAWHHMHILREGLQFVNIHDSFRIQILVD